MYIRTISIYLMFNILSALVPIVMLPILTKYLSPRDYGILAVFNIVSMLVGNLFRLELNSALKREYAENQTDFSRYISTAFMFSNFMFLLCGVVLLLLLPFLGDFYGIQPYWMLLILLLSYFRFYTVNLHHLLQLTNRALLYGIWGFVATLVSFGICIGLLIFVEANWQARAWAEVVVGVASFPLAIFFLRKHYLLKWQFDLGSLKKMLRFSLPLLASSMLAYLILVSDRMFIAKLSGPQELGLYTVAVQLSSVAGLFFGALLPTWESWIFMKRGGGNKQNISKVMKVLLAVALLSLVMILLLPRMLSWLLPYLTDKNFDGVDAYLTSTIVSASCVGLFGIISSILIFMRKTAALAYVKIAMAIVNCVGLYICIKVWGTVGAAYALSLTFVLGSLLMLFLILKFSNTSLRSLIFLHR